MTPRHRMRPTASVARATLAAARRIEVERLVRSRLRSGERPLDPGTA